MNKVEYFTDLAKSIEKDERRMNDDTISRKAAISIPLMPKEHRKYQTMNLDDAYDEGWGDYQACIAIMPSAERRGQWIEEYSANHFQAKCSACGESTLYGITYDLEGNAYYMNYCPNCGARMDGEEK